MNGREPGRWDYCAYLLVLPLVMATWLTALGVRPTADVGAWYVFFYIATRMLLAWWAAHAGALLAGRILRGRGKPLWLILLAGFLIILIPVSWLFDLQGQLFPMLFPALDGRIVHARFAWTAGYLGYFASRSVIFFLPVWMAVVHAYRKQFGVDWYSSGRRPVEAVDSSPAGSTTTAVPGVAPSFLRQSRLPADTRIYTLKAAEHYIEVVADRGKDLVRHRFTDAIQEMSALGLGCQVHRSWWVGWDGIAGIVPCGRSIELELHDGRRIPVSLTYKNGFLAQYRRQGGAAPGNARHPGEKAGRA